MHQTQRRRYSKRKIAWLGIPLILAVVKLSYPHPNVARPGHLTEANWRIALKVFSRLEDFNFITLGSLGTVRPPYVPAPDFLDLYHKTDNLPWDDFTPTAAVRMTRKLYDIAEKERSRFDFIYLSRSSGTLDTERLEDILHEEKFPHRIRAIYGGPWSDLLEGNSQFAGATRVHPWWPTNRERNKINRLVADAKLSLPDDHRYNDDIVRRAVKARVFEAFPRGFGSVDNILVAPGGITEEELGAAWANFTLGRHVVIFGANGEPVSGSRQNIFGWPVHASHFGIAERVKRALLRLAKQTMQ